MNPLDKAQSLRAARRRLGWTQSQLAKVLGLDRSYLSQLENYRKYRREVDEFYLQRLEVIEHERNLEQASGPAAKSRGAKPARVSPAESACLDHFVKFLKTCHGEPARLGWTLIELRERFPLDRWEH